MNVGSRIEIGQKTSTLAVQYFTVYLVLVAHILANRPIILDTVLIVENYNIRMEYIRKICNQKTRKIASGVKYMYGKMRNLCEKSNKCFIWSSEATKTKL